MIKATCNSSFTTTVTVEHTIDDLTMSEWRFDYSEKRHKLEAVRYRFMNRKTKRHGWVTIDHYDWHDKRNSTLDDMPAIPYEIIDAARKAFVETLVTGRRTV